MRVRYLGPMLLGIDHPALAGLSPDHFSPNAFAVEVREDAGCDGPIIEGDVLIAEERGSVLHDDLVIVEQDDEYHLMRAFRLNNRVRLLSLSGSEGCWARSGEVKGVITRQLRQY
ncbi:hypothetical protein R84981_001200 [Carnimonas sp. R-84981]|uniref:hypothetical protein n=1 Tax=Carnimonas bestiolae TaxID=3402172 RepID=UPI003EDBF6F6